MSKPMVQNEKTTPDAFDCTYSTVQIDGETSHNANKVEMSTNSEEAARKLRRRQTRKNNKQ